MTQADEISRVNFHIYPEQELKLITADVWFFCPLKNLTFCEGTVPLGVPQPPLSFGTYYGGEFSDTNIVAWTPTIRCCSECGVAAGLTLDSSKELVRRARVWWESLSANERKLVH